MDYIVKTGILIYTNFNIREFNDLMYESAKPHIVAVSYTHLTLPTTPYV